MSNPRDMENFTNITGSSKEDAAKWLSAHGGNLENAIGAFFDGPPNPPPDQHDAMKWDEGPFHSDKTVYGPQTQKQASFNVNPHDTLGPRVFDGTLSRPPSRVSNRGLSPGPGGNSKQLSVAEQEEEDINKAMAMSLNLPEQETGVTDVSGQHFGPARQTHYDTSQWAMSISGPRAQEILHNPDPELRRREPGQPAFLRPALGKHMLPPLLTILHGIPLTREAFLLRAYGVQDYGHNSDWWDGAKIETPKVLEVDQGYDQDPDWDEVLVEAQRLMAFLDHTDRAYGSCEALANVKWIREREDPVPGLLDLWRGTAARVPRTEELRDAFSWIVLTDGEFKDFSVIDFTNLNTAQSNPYYTIYDALDDSLWSAFRSTDADAAQIERIPEVLIFRLHVISPPHGIKVPAVWYADRYLKENADALRRMRLEKESFENKISRLKAEQGRLTNLFCLSSTLSGITLLTIARAYLEEDEALDFEMEDISKLVEVDSIDATSSTLCVRELAEEMSSAMNRVTEKIESLERLRAEALRQLHELSKLFTESSEDPDRLPHHRYTLRGVSTDYRTIYILKDRSDECSDDLLVTEASPGWQWWKITFTIGDVNPISYHKVREIEVLKAVKDGGGFQMLVVYASEKAVSYRESTLPTQLQSFVKMDNQAFAAEFEGASSKPATPTKRKVDETFDEDKSTNNSDDLVFPNYQSDPVSSTSPLKKPNDGVTTTPRNLFKWDVDPPSYDTAMSDAPLDSHRSDVEMSSPPRNKFTSINEIGPSISDPYILNTSKPRTTNNNPFLNAKLRTSGFDDMLPVSLSTRSSPSDSQSNTFAPSETTILDDDDDVVMHQPGSATATSWNQAAQMARNHEMQERTGNLGGVLRGVGRGFNPYQTGRQARELVMEDDGEKRKGG